MHVHVGPLVQTDGVAGLEPPRHAVPLALDVATVIARIVQLGDPDVDVEVLLEILLHQLHLRRHLGEVLVVEQRRWKTVRVPGVGEELLGLGRLVLPPRAEVLRRRRRVLIIDVGHAPAEDAVALEYGVHHLLAVDGHRDRAPHAQVIERRPILGERHTERRERVVVGLHHRLRIRLADEFRLRRARHPDEVGLARAERGLSRRRVGRGQDDVLVDVGTALVVIVRVALQDDAYLPRVLLERVRPGADEPLLEVAVLLEDFAREEDRHRLGDVLREQRVGSLEVHPRRVLVGRLDALDLLEREGLHAFLGVLLEAILHVGGHELAPVHRREVLPLDALP